jgi:hypothetical protein
VLVKLQHATVGLPDRLLLRPGGRASFIEFKRAGEQPSRIQLYWLHKLNWLGFRSDVVRSMAEFRALLTS